MGHGGFGRPGAPRTWADVKQMRWWAMTTRAAGIRCGNDPLALGGRDRNGGVKQGTEGREGLRGARCWACGTPGA